MQLQAARAQARHTHDQYALLPFFGRIPALKYAAKDIVLSYSPWSNVTIERHNYEYLKDSWTVQGELGPSMNLNQMLDTGPPVQ